MFWEISGFFEIFRDLLSFWSFQTYCCLYFCTYPSFFWDISRFFEFFWGRNLLFPLYSSRYLEIFWDLLRFFEFCLILSVLLRNNPCACPSIHLHWHALAFFSFFQSSAPVLIDLLDTATYDRHSSTYQMVSLYFMSHSGHANSHMGMWNQIGPNCFFWKKLVSH